MKISILILLGVALLLSGIHHLSKATQAVAEAVATNDPSVAALAQVTEITSAPEKLETNTPKAVVIHDKGGSFSIMSQTGDNKGPVPPVNPYLK